MANFKLKVKENVPGPFFVDKDCIACDSCTSIAREYFSLTQMHPQPTFPNNLQIQLKPKSVFQL